MTTLLSHGFDLAGPAGGAGARQSIDADAAAGESALVAWGYKAGNAGGSKGSDGWQGKWEASKREGKGGQVDKVHWVERGGWRLPGTGTDCKW